MTTFDKNTYGLRTTGGLDSLLQPKPLSYSVPEMTGYSDRVANIQRQFTQNASKSPAMLNAALGVTTSNRKDNPYLQSLYKGITAAHTGLMGSRGKINYLGVNQQAQQGRLKPIGDVVNAATEGLDMLAEAFKPKRQPILQKIGIYGRGGEMSTFDKVGNVAQTGAALLGNAVQQASLDVNPHDVNGAIASQQLKGYSSGMSLDDIADMYASAPNLNYTTRRDFRGSTGFMDAINAFGAGNQGAQAGFNVGGTVGAIVGGVLGTGSSLIGSMIGNHEAGNAMRSANRLIDKTMSYNDRLLADAAGNAEDDARALQEQQYTGVKLSSTAAFGGRLSNIKKGDEIEVTPEEARQLTLRGVQFEIL